MRTRGNLWVGIRFGSVEDFLKNKSMREATVKAKLIPSIFSEERIRLLKEIKKGGYSVSGLSKKVGRKIEHVSRDLAYLEKHGIISFKKSGREKIPQLANYELTIDI